MGVQLLADDALAAPVVPPPAGGPPPAQPQNGANIQASPLTQMFRLHPTRGNRPHKDSTMRDPSHPNDPSKKIKKPEDISGLHGHLIGEWLPKPSSKEPK